VVKDNRRRRGEPSPNANDRPDVGRSFALENWRGIAGISVLVERVDHAALTSGEVAVGVVAGGVVTDGVDGPSAITRLPCGR